MRYSWPNIVILSPQAKDLPEDAALHSREILRRCAPQNDELS